MTTPHEHDPWEGLPEDLQQWRPHTRTVREPVPLGRHPDGEPAFLSLWRRDCGSRHPVVGGATGSGKSNLINCLMAGLVPCPDVVIWYIEIAKLGKGAAAWAPCIDWLANTPVEALAMLQTARRVIKARAQALARQTAKGSGSDKVQPSRAMPAALIIIDEAAALFDITAGDPELVAISMEATEVAGKIAAEGRELGVGMLVATQRPSVKSLGNNGDLRAQFAPAVCLRMRSRGDVGFVLTGVDLDTVDATLFNVPGLLYVQDSDGAEPLPIRAYALYEPAQVLRIARLYAPHRPPLDAVSAQAAGHPYAVRTDPGALFANPGAPSKRPVPPPSERSVSDIEPGTDPTAADHAAAAAARQTAAAALTAARAAVAADGDLVVVPKLPMAALRPTGAAPEDPGDPGARARARAVIADAPPEGLAASVIARTAQINRTSAYRVLRQLTDAGDVVQTGSKGTWRYHPAAVPTAEQDTTTERGA